MNEKNVIPDYIVVDLKRRRVIGMNPKSKSYCKAYFEACGVAIGILFDRITPMTKFLDESCSKTLTKVRLKNLGTEIQLPDDLPGEQLQCRVYNALRIIGVKSYLDLTQKTVNDLLSVRLGDKCIRYVQSHLADLGLKLKE